TGLPVTGEVTDRRVRAEMLDEGIDLMRTLWAGGTEYHGEHYRYEGPRGDLMAIASQVREHIPIWVAGAWPRPKSMRRGARRVGVVPEYHRGGRDGTGDDVRELRAWLAENGARPDLDVISEGETPADDPKAAADLVRPWAEAGCTWWLETR